MMSGTRIVENDTGENGRARRLAAPKHRQTDHTEAPSPRISHLLWLSWQPANWVLAGGG